jgi:hypothetical protein
VEEENFKKEVLHHGNLEIHQQVENHIQTQDITTKMIPIHNDYQIGGRITHFIENWKKINCSNQVLDLIKYGLKINVEEDKIIKIYQTKLKQK